MDAIWEYVFGCANLGNRLGTQDDVNCKIIVLRHLQGVIFFAWLFNWTVAPLSCHGLLSWRRAKICHAHVYMCASSMCIVHIRYLEIVLSLTGGESRVIHPSSTRKIGTLGSNAVQLHYSATGFYPWCCIWLSFPCYLASLDLLLWKILWLKICFWLAAFDMFLTVFVFATVIFVNCHVCGCFLRNLFFVACGFNQILLVSIIVIKLLIVSHYIVVICCNFL